MKNAVLSTLFLVLSTLACNVPAEVGEIDSFNGQRDVIELSEVEPTARIRSDEIGTIDDIQTWWYLIDVNLDLKTVDQIAASTYDMVVLDFIPSESNNTDFPMAEVNDKLHNTDPPKLVLAYIDIGEAEEYRTYWQSGWSIGDPE